MTASSGPDHGTTTPSRSELLRRRRAPRHRVPHRLTAPASVAGLALAALVTVSATVAGATVAGAAGSGSAALGDVVRIDTGVVRGQVTPTQRRFAAIPYAAAPVGARRFRPPQAATSWTGVRDATGSAAACPQSAPVVGTLLPSQEDCLTLDVHTPPASTAAPAGGFPVMVWFYGGAYVIGATGSDPAPLIRTGRVIVVQVNYRLGPFGFLTLPGLEAESTTGTSGNMGLLDQQAGLRWVQRNITAFGGDPHAVTIFGESAGGNSVCQQIASPLARGLFARAISQSGACSGQALRTVPKAQMVARSRAYARELGCTSAATELACLRRLPVSTLLSSPTVQFSSMGLTWQPSVDGYVEPRDLDQAWATGQYTHVPMIVGNNHDEGRLFVFLFSHLQQLTTVTPQAYTAFIRQSFPADADRVLARYPLSAYPSPDLAEAAVITDGFFACPAVRSQRRIGAGGSPIWAYELNTVDPPLQVDPVMPLGNAHAFDLFYLFDSIQQLPVVPLPVVRDATQARLSAQLAQAWTAFAATGNPGTVGGVRWARWTASSPGALRIDAAGHRMVGDVPAAHRCDFWEPVLD